MDDLDQYSEISSEDSNSPEVKAHRKEWAQFMSKMFGSDLFSDVTIVVGGKEIKAHKLCLACGNPVFKAMLEADCKESNQSIIRIDDFDYDVVMQMLEYVYTSKAPKINEMADKLLTIAEKYNITLLKRKCERFLIPTICVNNVLQILVLADRNGATKLEEAAFSFLKVHYKDVRETDGWNTMRLNHSEIYQKITDHGYCYVSPKKVKRM